jgi:hypothetical protein
LTITAEEVAEWQSFNKAWIIPLHFEGCGHFTESYTKIEGKFKSAGLLHRLHWAKALTRKTKPPIV